MAELAVNCPKCRKTVSVPISEDVHEFVCTHCGDCVAVHGLGCVVIVGCLSCAPAPAVPPHRDYRTLPSLPAHAADASRIHTKGCKRNLDFIVNET